MNILLVSLYFDPNAMALRLLSAVLKQELPADTTKLLFLSHKSKPPRMDFDLETPEDLKAIQQFVTFEKPDIVGISLMSNYFDRAVQLTSAIREVIDTTILFGGVHATLRPEECIEHADVVFVGEAEQSLPLVIKRIKDGQTLKGVPGIWIRENGRPVGQGVCPSLENLNSLPPPDFDFDSHFIFSPNERKVIPFQRGDFRSATFAFYNGAPFYRILTTRGCSQSCAFCINAKYRNMLGLKQYIRKRSLESVMTELRQIVSLGIADRIMFIDDDLFLHSRDWIEQFKDAYKREVKLPFGCNATPGHVQPAKLRLLCDAGLSTINIGVQTGSDTLNDQIFNRKLKKKHLLKAVQVVNTEAPQIGVGLDFLVRNPFETLSHKIETAKLLLELDSRYIVKPYALTLFPGLPLTERAAREGILKDNCASSIYDYPGSDEENAWQKVLTHSRRIPQACRKELLCLLEESPPTTTQELVDLLQQNGAELPNTNPKPKAITAPKPPLSREERIQNHYCLGASHLRNKEHKSAQIEFQVALGFVEELLTESHLENNADIVDNYIHILMMILQCMNAQKEFRSAQQLLQTMTDSQHVAIPAKYKPVFKQWLLKYDDVIQS
jgi:radical SAM superfamily enzyme YgiQ (UPF0313 family)